MDQRDTDIESLPLRGPIRPGARASAAEPDWLLRWRDRAGAVDAEAAVRGRVSKHHAGEIVSFIVGGGMFVLIGLYVSSLAGVLGHWISGIGVGAWLIGCARFVMVCSRRRGWALVLLQLHVFGMLPMLVLLVLLGGAGALSAWFGQTDDGARLFETLRRVPFFKSASHEFLQTILQGIAMIFFARECARVMRFCQGKRA